MRMLKVEKYGPQLLSLAEGLCGSSTLIDVTPPKFGATHVMFVLDRGADIYAQDGILVQPNNRMQPPHAPFWYEGEPTPEDIWGFPANAAGFVDYCPSVGLAISDYPTDPVRG